MTRVLVAAEVETFLRERDAPGDVRVDLLDPADPVPAGDHAGILTLLTRRIGHAELDRLPRLRIIANMAVGYDNVDLAAARQRGILVSNTPDVLTDATAELTWALILATARRVVEGDRLVRAGEWAGWEPTQLLGTGLRGKLLGIVGAGRIGRDVGRGAGPFGMRVAYWSRTVRPDFERETGAERVMALADLAARADILSIHLASSTQTRGIIDRDVLHRMKPGAILVNTARGDLVDEPALTDCLESGRIRAALDVFAAEPHVPERLRRLDNVVLLPHLGSATRETRQAMFDMAWDNLMRGVRGEPLLSPVT
jgi:glyoxylate reductase